jgi:pimeloyl-ACP methyl ester carboxylesterase
VDEGIFGKMERIAFWALGLLCCVLAIEASDANAQESTSGTTGSPESNLARLTSITPPPQLSDRELGLHRAPCLPGTWLGVGEVEGEDYICGIFTVPQNWEHPDGRNLDLGFLVARATGDRARPDPLLFLAGGPGQSSILAPTVEKYRSVRSERDIIFFDMRGAGVSQRLGVEECFVLAIQNGLPTDELGTLQAAAAGFLAISRGEEAPRSPDLWDLNIPVLNETCWEQFTVQGIDPNQFTTAASARDAIELTRALDYEEFNIEGVSYGTRLAMTIMDSLPEYESAPTMRSVILDSTFPPSVYLIRTLVRSDHDPILQLLDECRSDAACDEVYPNFEEQLGDLLERLEIGPIMISGETVALPDFVEQVTNLSGTRAAYIPKMIAELAEGELSTYLSLREGQVGTGSPERSSGVTLDMTDPVQAFINDASSLLDEAAAAEFSFYATVSLVQDDPLATLRAMIADVYPSDIRDQMLEMLEPLSEEVIATSPYVAQQLAVLSASDDSPEAQLARLRRSVNAALPHFLYTAIHCADDILHERYEDALNSYNDLRFPQLTTLDMSRAQSGRCSSWPMTAAPIAVKDPMNSNVPTLILQGTYDEPTPIYMGMRAHRELENSTFVLIPQQGHGAWNEAQSCVGQIAAAFLDAPSADVDLDCLEARRPEWAQP